MVNSTSRKLSGHAKDETGNRYGKLVVLKFSHVKRQVHWLCRCDCGNTTTVSGGHLREGTTTSCGCVILKSNGMSGSPIYQVWQAMKDRCCNPKNRHYRNYGARGIRVSARWMESFSNFFEDMGERPFEGATLERVDNSKGYSKDNCKWATRHEQMANCRTAKLLTYNGETKCMSQWARDLGVDPKTLTYRLKQGWTLEKALTTAATPASERKARMLTHDGQTLCLADWARKLGVGADTLRDRINRGLPDELVFSSERYAHRSS